MYKVLVKLCDIMHVRCYFRKCSRSYILCLSGFGGLVVSMLASGTQDRGFDPGRSRHAFLGGGEVKPSPMSQICAACQRTGFTWKSKSQAKLTGHFSPVIPSFADRGLSCRLHVKAPRGESGNV